MCIPVYSSIVHKGHYILLGATYTLGAIYSFALSVLSTVSHSRCYLQFRTLGAACIGSSCTLYTSRCYLQLHTLGAIYSCTLGAIYSFTLSVLSTVALSVLPTLSVLPSLKFLFWGVLCLRKKNKTLFVGDNSRDFFGVFFWTPNWYSDF